MDTQQRHTEETKMMIPRGDVTISPEGHVTIKNARLAEKLRGISGNVMRDEGGTSIGVTATHTF